MALNGHSEYWQNFLTQLYKMAAHPEKKVLPFTKDYNILTEPIRIDLVTEKGDKLSDADKARLANLTSRNNPTGNTGRVVLIMIEFYKPLFECLLQKNRKGEIGRNYIQIPKALQAETKATIEKLRDTGFFRGSDLDAEKVPVYEADARAIFLYMAQHDNRQGDRITIDAVDFVNSCFPSCLKFTPITNQETGEIEKKPYISKHDGFQIRSKIKKTIVTFKQMGKSGKMDGGQFIPMELDETKVQYNHEAQTYVIKVLRPKNQLAPVFKPEDIEWDAIPF
jgi:hypothetical protein